MKNLFDKISLFIAGAGLGWGLGNILAKKIYNLLPCEILEEEDIEKYLTPDVFSFAISVPVGLFIATILGDSNGERKLD